MELKFGSLEMNSISYPILISLYQLKNASHKMNQLNSKHFVSFHFTVRITRDKCNNEL